MNRKRLIVSLFLIVLMLLVFNGCSTDNPEPTEPTNDISVNADIAISNTTTAIPSIESTTTLPDITSSTTMGTTTSYADTTVSTTTETTELSTDSISNLLESTTNGSVTPSLPEEAQKPTEDPAYGFIWALDEESIANADNDPETIKEIIFDGRPITIYCQLKNGSSKSWEFGLFVDVEGVFQELEVGGIKTELYCFELQPLETRTVKMSFVPNIGKRGEVKNLSCAVLLSPNYVAQADGSYGLYLEPGVSGNYPLIMNADSSNKANVSNNSSLYTVSTINRTIYSNYDESGNLEDFESFPFCYVYEKLNDYIYKDKGNFIRTTKITSKSSQSSNLTVNIHGKPGSYRASVYLNGERINAFDGKGYVDVTIGNRQQAEIPVVIDTRNLKGANRIEVYYKEINCDYAEGSILASSGPHKYIVK